VTEPAVTVKVPVVAPAATVAETGVVNAVLLSERVTVVPPLGAAPDNVTVQVELALEATLVGEQASLLSVTAAGAVIVTAEVAVLPFSDAVIVTDWLLVTEPAVTVKLPVVAPAATVAEAGVVNAVLLSERATAEPPLGAAPDNVTVQVELALEATLVGEQASLLSVTAAGAVIVTAAVAVLPFSDAVIVTDWVLVTEPAVTVKVPVVAPAATVAEAGVVNAVLLSERVTTEPPLGAAPDNVTVQVELALEATLVGEQASLLSVTAAGAVIVTAAVAVLPFSDAVIVTDWVLVTEPAVTVKLPVVAPAATVAEAGVVNAVLLSERVTAEPPLGAAPDNVTVQVELALEATLVGEQASLLSVTAAGAVIVTAAVAVLPFSDAVIVTDWLLVTEPAVTVKVPVVAPAATVAEAGVVNAVLLSERVTVVPPLGAAPDNVAVQVELAPEATLAGLHCTEEMVGGAATAVVPTAVFMSA
jgi:hypothetical protein